MSDGSVVAPASEEELAGAVAEAARGGQPLAVEGNGTKRPMLRPVQAARTLSTRNLTGITLYKPQELILSARAGTPLPEVEAALAELNRGLEDKVRARTKEARDLAGRAGLVMTWPVEDGADAARLVGWGVRGLIVDDLGLLAALRRQYGR